MPLPEIAEGIRDNRRYDKEILDHLDTIAANTQAFEQTLANFVTLFSDKLVDLGNKVTTLTQNQADGLKDMQESVGVNRYRELADVMDQRFAQLSEQVASDRGTVTNSLDTLRASVEAQDARNTVEQGTDLTEIENSLQSLTAALNGITQATEGRNATIENKITDIANVLNVVLEKLERVVI